MSESRDDDDEELRSLEIEDEAEEHTPADTRGAVNAAVFRSEKYSKKAAFYAFKSYQIVIASQARIAALEKQVAIRRGSFGLAAVALTVALCALMLAGCVARGWSWH